MHRPTPTTHTHVQMLMGLSHCATKTEGGTAATVAAIFAETGGGDAASSSQPSSSRELHYRRAMFSPRYMSESIAATRFVKLADLKLVR